MFISDVLYMYRCKGKTWSLFIYGYLESIVFRTRMSRISLIHIIPFHKCKEKHEYYEYFFYDSGF